MSSSFLHRKILDLLNMAPTKLTFLVLVFLTFAAMMPLLMAQAIESVTSGPCEATNSIDKCWRCRPDWHLNRKALADCVIGFGKDTTGGKAGEYYVVTDPSDNDVVHPKEGTLRWAVIQPVPLWITFKHDMTIKLKQELLMQSDKTIDGRGAKVHITKGAGITIQGVNNIIIHNIYIHDLVVTKGGLIRDSTTHYGNRGVSDGDGINVFGAKNLWFDHLTMSNGPDGLIDIVEGSDAITISNCVWTNHDHTLLFGARDNNAPDEQMKVSVVYNHFGKGLIQRMPHLRNGFVHIVNNAYTEWGMYAIGGTSKATIISEGNRFYASDNKNLKQITHREGPESEWRKWTWRSQGDVLLNGAFFTESGDPNGVQKYAPRDGIVAEPGTQVEFLTKFVGVIDTCKEGVAC